MGEQEWADCTCGLTNGAGVAEDPRCPTHAPDSQEADGRRWTIYVGIGGVAVRQPSPDEAHRLGFKAVEVAPVSVVEELRHALEQIESAATAFVLNEVDDQARLDRILETAQRALASSPPAQGGRLTSEETEGASWLPLDTAGPGGTDG